MPLWNTLFLVVRPTTHEEIASEADPGMPARLGDVVDAIRSVEANLLRRKNKRQRVYSRVMVKPQRLHNAGPDF